MVVQGNLSATRQAFTPWTSRCLFPPLPYHTTGSQPPTVARPRRPCFTRRLPLELVFPFSKLSKQMRPLFPNSPLLHRPQRSPSALCTAGPRFLIAADTMYLPGLVVVQGACLFR